MLATSRNPRPVTFDPPLTACDGFGLSATAFTFTTGLAGGGIGNFSTGIGVAFTLAVGAGEATGFMLGLIVGFGIGATSALMIWGIAAGVASVTQAWRAAMPGISLGNYAIRHKELRQSLEKVR